MAKIIDPIASITPFPWADGTYRSREEPAGGNLYSFQLNPMQHLGGYFLNPAGNATNPDGMTYAGRTRICLGTADDRIFATAHSDGTSGTRWLAEWQIPTIVAGTDLNARNVGARLQEYRFIETDFGELGAPEIAGLYHNPNTGALIVGYYEYYDSSGAAAFSHVHYNNGADLATSSRVGPYNVNPGDPAHFAGQIIELPPAWQAVFGGTHLVHNGIKMSIASRSSIGPNCAVINAANPQAGIIRELMNFPYGNNWETSIGNLGGSGQPYANDPLWNFLSDVAGACVLPGTDTLMFVGTTLDMRVPNNGTVYKGIAENSSGAFVWQDGFNPYIYQGMSPYVWLFDLNDLARTVADPVTYPPHIHRPYWHGYWDIPGVDKRDGFQPRGAFLHRTTRQLHVSIQRGGAPRYNSGEPRFEVFNIPGVSV